MANGDPLSIGLTQPPYNRATSTTALIHNSDGFGTQTSSFWVQRYVAPLATAAIRGDNFSTGPSNGQTITGVSGMIEGRFTQPGAIGVLGAQTAGQALPGLGEIGVMGVTNSFGVVGVGLVSLRGPDGELLESSIGVQGKSDDGIGVRGDSITGFGVIGSSASGTGVTGSSDSSAGVSGASTSDVGVVGQSEGFAGVRGVATTGYGVLGESNRVAILGISPTNAVQGVSNGPAGASIGVAGSSELGAGVQGSSNNIGVAGLSPSGIGGHFSGQTGVRGDSFAGIGVVGTTSRRFGVAAGHFTGPVVIVGSLQVTGAKSAVVKHKDGSQRALFCLESAESMLQDFGEVTLRSSSVFVKFAPDFASLIKRNEYQVFLTSYGPAAVYVSKRMRDGFEISHVNAPQRRTKGISIGYSIVARRGDLKNERLPKVDLPVVPLKVMGPKVLKTTAIVNHQTKLRQPPPAPNIAIPDLADSSPSDPKETIRKKNSSRSKSS